VGTKGFSIRTGIPGLSFRQSWGKDAGAVAIILVLALAAFAVVALMVRLLIFVVPIIWQGIAWLALTTYDLAVYLSGRFKSWLAQRNA